MINHLDWFRRVEMASFYLSIYLSIYLKKIMSIYPSELKSTFSYIKYTKYSNNNIAFL